MRIEDLTTKLAAWSTRHPRLVLITAAVLAVAALVTAGFNLGLKTSNLDLIDPTLPEVAGFLDYANEFGTPNVLVVVVEGESESNLVEAVTILAPRLREGPGVRSVVDRLPFDQALADLTGRDPHLFSRDRRMAFLFVQPDDPYSSAETIGPFVDGAREALADPRLKQLNVQAGLTGIPAYAIDDRDIIQRDVAVLSTGASLLILILFVAAFGNFRRPALAILALLTGALFTVGLLTGWPGHLTLLSATFGTTLFGLGIDFAIHIINRVEELVAEGRSEAEAVAGALHTLGRGLTTGAVTTAGVFFCMLASGFQGFEELGFIAGAGVLLCLLAMMTVLPALLVLFGPQRPGKYAKPKLRLGFFLDRLQNRYLAAGLAVAAILFALRGDPGFDSNYLNLQPRDSETARLEREMVERSEFSPQFAVFVSETEPEARDIAFRLTDEETVAKVRFPPKHALASRDPSQQEFLSHFRSSAGRYAVYAYPRGNIWDPGEQEAFVAAMRGINGGVTGMPFLGQFMIEQSRRALRITAGLAVVVLVLVVTLDFRRPLPVVLALLPTALTAAAMMAIMRALGLAFNPLNVMALPVVLGIAVDDGVHMVHRFITERGDVARTLHGTGRSIVLTSATTMAAFGAVAFTSHRGLAGFCLAICIGVGSALVMSLLVLPTFLALSRSKLVRERV